MTKSSLPQGTRDFGPEVVRKRNYILNTIKNVFELYGFEPLETPAMENLDTLMGKYGEEGDKLIFKILNNGLDHPDKHKNAIDAFENILQGKSDKRVTERALKYDLTIPFARYVAMNYNKLTFPFKRYQIQPVWRADRPQKGRYREFYQCDADVVGSNSLLNEVELANIYTDVFTQLGIKNFELRLNHRKILTALAELCGGIEKMNAIAIVIDKLDKIGLEKVKDELKQKGYSTDQLVLIEKYLSVSGTNEEKISQIKTLLGKSTIGINGIKELEYLINSGLPTPDSRLKIDFTLARGLNYYTGIIFEVQAPPEVKMGSIGGGGRYDDLTGLFGVPDIPGVGISFGVDRIYDVLEEMDLFPKDIRIGTQVLFLNTGEIESKQAFELAQQLRSKGIRCELYHATINIDKQYKYAEKKNIPYVVILDTDDIVKNSCTIKNIVNGVKQTILQNELLKYKF